MIRYPKACAAAAARSAPFWLTVLATFSLAGPTIARADITTLGDVEPTNLATWTSNTAVYVGNTASGTLTVNNGIGLHTWSGCIGNSSAATGVVNVSGAGSFWTADWGLLIGMDGKGALSITSGASVTCAYSFSAYGTAIGDDSGSSGSVVVDGIGSKWTTNANPGLYVGSSGSGTLTISNGGSVVTAGYYGCHIGSSSGSMGWVKVDSGATWSILGRTDVQEGGYLYVGDSGSGKLSITNGGSVSVALYTYVGASDSSTGMIDFGANGGTLTTKSLFVSPSQLAGTGTINTRGLVSDADVRFDSARGLTPSILFQQPGQNVTVNIDMASAPSANGALGAGWNGAGSLTIQDGIAVNSAEGYIGYKSSSSGIVTVTGTGSTWTNSSLYVGNLGAGTLSVRSGGTVTTFADMITGSIGDGPGSSGVVNIDGAGSTWVVNGNTVCDVYIGNRGSGTLTITNGGRVNSGGSTIANSPGSTGLVVVDGAGSSWVGSDLVVGNGGCARLSISNGGAVDSRPGMGFSDVSVTGIVTVDGAGSTWIAPELTIEGTVSITNRGSGATTGTCYIGQNLGLGGVVTVDGPGSSWSVTGSELMVGYHGGGTLSITNGGSVSVPTTTFVGFGAGSTGTVNFGTSGGTLSTQSLYASPSQLLGTGTINANGLLSDIDLKFDSSHGLIQTIALQQAGQNILLDLDMGTNPKINGTLGVGWNGAGSLTIQDGVQVTSSSAGLGYWPGSIGIATVTGTNSKWTSSGGFGVGYNGRGTLTITSGGIVNSFTGSVGEGSGSQGLAIVDGTGSAWTGNADLHVGGSGIGTLLITHGGSVTSGGGSSGLAGYVGYNPGSTGVVSVDGAGSLWANNGDIFIGNGGSGTLSITNGGSVSVTGATYVGYKSGSTGLIDFGANGGTLTTKYLYLAQSQLSGTGTINASGFVCDLNAVLDSSFAVQHAFTVQQPGTNVTIRLNSITNAADLGAGWIGAGSLTIKDGVKVTSANGYLGYQSGSTGTAKISGNGSTWATSAIFGLFLVGDSGSGILSITGGGSVSETHGGTVSIGHNAGSNGVVDVDGVGSTWNLRNPLNPLYVGNSGTGSLCITNGGSVTTGGQIADIGNAPGSTGVVSVDGVGSTLNVNSLVVGNSGGGTLSVTNGGSVIGGTGTSYVAQNSTNGAVIVDGAGSKWNPYSLSFGASGTLSVTGGGTVAVTQQAELNNGSLFSIDVGRGSLLSASWRLWCSGTLRVVVGAGVPADGTTYSPMSAGTWVMMPTYQPIGGTWNATAHTFTPSSVTNGTVGLPLSLDLASVQRALVTDSGPSGTGWTVGASFPAAGSTTNMTFTATPMNQTILDVLRGELPVGESVLSGWSFSTTGFTATSDNPIYLSFQVGSGLTSENLDVWHYDGGAWTEYSALDLTYDGNYASFTANGLSGYAMVAVPEPATVVLLALACLGLLGYAWRRRR